MAAVSVLMEEESLLCGICLELLKEAVTIPCGHTFCLGCIQSCWCEAGDGGDRRCPHCRQSFAPAPHLHKNLILCKIVDDFASSRARVSISLAADGGKVSCDFCTGTKMGAAKSCSVCLVSYCELHLKPHRENAAFQHHSLTEPIGDLNQRRCPAHGKLLDLFCRTDQIFICSFCTTERHRNHQTVTVEEEVSKQKKQLAHEEVEVATQIQRTLAEIRNLQQTIDSITTAALNVESEITNKFMAMAEAIQETQREVIGLVEGEERASLSQADSIRNQLEEKCTQLRAREKQLKTLSLSSDQLRLIQESLAVNEATQSLEFPQLRRDIFVTIAHASEVVTELSVLVTGYLREAVNHGLKNRGTKGRKAEIAPGPLSLHVAPFHSDPVTREDFLRYAAKLTFDPNTANNYLSLSAGNRTVMECFPESGGYLEHPDRFDTLWHVLCAESLCAGKYYWEVCGQAGPRGFAANLGIAYGRINRKGADLSCSIGGNAVSWCLSVSPDGGRRQRFSARHRNKSFDIPRVACERIGLYLDWPAGTLAIYDVVAGAMTLIHRFRSVFTEPLFPAFGVYSKSSLTIQQLP
ncbi:tripartite motif-containing protein 16-like [Callorhinchus milii]|uniref:tripartite motif-containing protein 16-like n=1 Tax=Callorhinchus milii TaxID=7868 RepID=UPI001C3F706C|nr:tripartite motif-containing protein 16-like [Callorhinchus milii]